MISNLIATLSRILPLSIERAEWSDPILSICGGGWSFNTTSTWRLVDEDKLISGSEDESSKNAIKGLVGLDIVRCEPMSSTPTLDPRFVYKNGLKLEVFSATVTEPWVFSLRDGPTFVASPSS